MINFNGGTVSLGASISPLGLYAGYLLMHSDNFWLAVCFLSLTALYSCILGAMLVRFLINYRRILRERMDDMASSARAYPVR